MGRNDFAATLAEVAKGVDLVATNLFLRYKWPAHWKCLETKEKKTVQDIRMESGI